MPPKKPDNDDSSFIHPESPPPGLVLGSNLPPESAGEPQKKRARSDQIQDENSQEQLTSTISKELGVFVKGQSATFACGGSIPVSEEATPAEASGDAADPTCPPIALRWDTAEGVDKLVFPVADTDGGKEKLAKLLRDCEPASFGYNGKDVLDETYRKAVKLDRSAFSSDFCPYELGIVDTIAQILLPDASAKYATHGVRAELYKLNIYSSPSGFFKSHVDTPRSKAQFGSLVVSLPSLYEGGQLVVRHAGHETTFDWSSQSKNAICWAAFYSDCEHEVKEIVQGHRVTLTYNLFFSLGVGDLAVECPTLDVRAFPLYSKIEQALANPDFMTSGGYLGIFCSHAYAHSTEAGAESLPGILKGADMAVYAVFRAHGLQVDVRPVLEDAETLRNMLEVEQDDYRYCQEHPEFMKYSAKPSEPKVDDPKWRPYRQVGRLGSVCVTEAGGSDGYSWEDIVEEWKHQTLDIQWLSEPSQKVREKGFVHLTYGNNTGIDAEYTYAALLVEIPPAKKRPSTGHHAPSWSDSD